MTFRKFLHCYDISSKIVETFQVLMKSNFYAIFSPSDKQAVPPPGHVLDRDGIAYGTSTRFYFTCLMSPSSMSMAPIFSAKRNTFLLSLIIAVIEFGISPSNRLDDS